MKDSLRGPIASAIFGFRLRALLGITVVTPTAALGQTRTFLLGAARPLSPTADVPSRTSGAAMGQKRKSTNLFDLSCLAVSLHRLSTSPCYLSVKGASRMKRGQSSYEAEDCFYSWMFYPGGDRRPNGGILWLARSQPVSFC
jgi:hypothetical protein